MSFWSDFLQTIENAGKGIANTAINAFGGVGQLGATQVAPKGVPGAEKALRQEVQRVIVENNDYDISDEDQSNDLILQTAVALNERVISPYITRPTATLGLLTDYDSPLYKAGEYEKGFQVSDITDAYNRSKKVSPMQALTKSQLLSFSPTLSRFQKGVFEFAGIREDEINLWDDKSIEKNFSENVVGKYYTGIGDFIVGDAALLGAGKIIGIGAKSAARVSGLSTKGKTISAFADDIEEGFKWADSNGTTGTQSTAASHMQELASSKDYATITTLANQYTTNADLIPYLHRASSREITRDLILADKGDVNAMIRLTQTEPDALFEIADVPGQIFSNNLLKGELFIPEGPAVQRLADAMEAAIKRNPQYDELRKVFLDDNYNPLVGGRAGYTPAEPKMFKSQFIKADKAVRGLKAEAKYRDFDTLTNLVENSRFAEVKIGAWLGGKTISLVKLVSRGTGNMPLGYVTFSGMRPMDGYKELNAFMDDIALFRDGSRMIQTGPGVKDLKRASDVRKDFEAMYFNSTNEIDQVKALEEIDTLVGRYIAYNNGWYEIPKIDAAIAQFRSQITRSSQAFQKNGYAVDFKGEFMTTNAQTLRQLAESYRFTPWNDIEREFIRMNSTATKAGTSVVSQNIKSVYEDLTRLWTFDVLARPMFIVKQSITEPLITVALAGGINEVRSAVGNLTMRGLTNARNRVMIKASRVMNKKELEAVNELVITKQTSLSRAIAIKDDLQAEYESLLSSGSVALREQHLPQVQKELSNANKLVDELEMDYMAAVKPFGIRESIPSVSLLERRIAYIENKAPAEMKARLAADIANAKSAISQHKGTLNSMAINRKVIQDAEDRLSAAYDDIDKVVGDLSYARRVQADTFGKSDKYRKAYVGKTEQYRTVPGLGYVKIDSFVNDVEGNNFVRAVKGEVQNTATVEMNYLGDLAVGTKISALKRKTPNIPIDTASPIYYQELAHVANDFVRRDPLMDLILAEKSSRDLYAWGLSSEGRSYLQHFGITEPHQIPTYIDEKIALIQRTFPSVEARALILKQEVEPGQLQKLLAPYESELFEIAPSTWSYADNAVFGRNAFESIENAIGTATSWVFKKLTSPENPIRESLFDKFAIDNMAAKAEILVSQGIKMTPARWNALRQASGREALQELEQTVYTVRRHNRMLHAARAGIAFPTASLSAFYRYGRLAIKNPQRIAGFLYDYQRTFLTFGVDKDGNPTKDINQISHIIVPGTKELGLGIYDEGIALNARSLGFMLNWPSPSFISAISVGKIMRKFDSLEEPIKNALGPLYNVWFPYGPPDSLQKQFTPIWLNAAWNAVTGDMGKTDYLASYQSVYDYHKMLNELGIEKKFPTDSQLDLETRKLWEQKARWAFISPFGVPIKVQTNKMDMVDTLWYTLMNKYESQGKSYSEAKQLAGDEMLATLGPKFMVDRVSFNPSNVRLNVPETSEAWDKIFTQNVDLVEKLANIRGEGNIRLVGLLTADMKVKYEDRNTAVVKKLNDPDLVLTGTSKAVNGLKMRPEEIERLRLINRTWEEYSNIRKAIEAKITDGKPLRAHPELQKGLEYAVNTYLKEKNRDWFDEYQRGANGDTAFEYSRAFNIITQDKKFMDANINSKFWQDVTAFNATRNAAIMIYDFLPAGDPRKAKIKEMYLFTIAKQAAGYHPELRRIIEQSFDNDNMKAAN